MMPERIAMNSVSVLPFVAIPPIAQQVFRCRVLFPTGAVFVMSEVWAKADLPIADEGKAHDVPDSDGRYVLIIRYIWESTGQIFYPEPSSVAWTALSLPALKPVRGEAVPGSYGRSPLRRGLTIA